jgi:hypothetical protein
MMLQLPFYNPPNRVVKVLLYTEVSVPLFDQSTLCEVRTPFASKKNNSDTSMFELQGTDQPANFVGSNVERNTDDKEALSSLLPEIHFEFSLFM